MSSIASHHIDDLESLLVTLQNTLGIIVPDEQRSILLGKIAPLLSIYKLDSLASLAESIEQNKPETIKSVVFDVISQTQMGWVLNSEIKEVLNDYIFSQLPDKANVWILGCGQGQAAYTIAMDLADFEHNSGDAKNIQFIATDVSASDVEYAGLGKYNKLQMADLSEEHTRLYMSAEDKSDELQVKDSIRQKMKFMQYDLADDSPAFEQMDLIICLDVLAYFSVEVKLRILQQCSDLLKSGGILVTGNNQIFVPSISTLERVEHTSGIFYRQKG
jgi:chemotaxis methyl-accepting protein methylase